MTRSLAVGFQTTTGGYISTAPRRLRAMATKSPSVGSLADRVGERIKPLKRRTWLDRLGDHDQAEVRETRRRYHAGGYGTQSAASVARALLELAAENGWQLVGEKELAEWLTKAS
jgi:hypothetical protein